MRPELKHQVFVDFARGLATLSTCKRLAVGCIISDLRNVYAIGYNGQPAGIPHDRCKADEGVCGCVHAEANAIAKLSSTEPDLWLHTTISPCKLCAGLIINRGNISCVTYDKCYRDTSGILLLKEAGIDVDMFKRG
jgi:dCMP deaminase